MASNAVRTGMLALALAVLCALAAGRPPLAAGAGSDSAAGSAEAVQAGAGPVAALTLAQAATDAGPPPPRAIREAQALLAGLGYAPGPADGVWGRRTERAYRAFLRDAGLPDAKRLTPEALRAMRAIAQRAGVTPGGAATGAAPAAAAPPDALHRAAAAGDVAGLYAALSAGAVVDARDGQGWTALMHAVNKGYPRLVGPLLAAGAAVDAQAPDGATALFMAVVLGHTEVVGLLMEAEADTTVKGPKGKTAVDVASTVGDPAILKALGSSVLSPKCAELPGSYPHGSGDNHASAQCWQELADNPGCYAYRSHYHSGESVRGTGACRGGRLERGTLTVKGDGVVAEGPVVDGKENGHWVVRWADGSVSEGPVVDGKGNGRWVIRSASGQVDEGPMVDDKKNGRWVVRWANGGCSMIEYSRGVEVGDRASC